MYEKDPCDTVNTSYKKAVRCGPKTTVTERQRR